MNILVIDDDASLRRTVRMSLEVLGHRATEARDSAQALDVLARRPFDAALLDLRLAQERGLDLLPQLLSVTPGLHVVVVTAYATIETAVEAMRRGAFDYLPKPFTPEQLRIVLDRIAQCGGSSRTSTSWKRRSAAWCLKSTCRPRSRRCARPSTWPSRGGHGGHDPHSRRKRDGQRCVGPRDSRPQPARRGSVCHGALPSLSAELLESELFGHVLGAFTGAVRDTLGKVAAAEGGTIFLDEIGDLPLALQPKLLRLLQERCYERVGDTRTRASNVRILAATNRDLEAEIAAGRFREDLFYRLNVIEVTVPPLRDRATDILPLAEHLLHFFARQNSKYVAGFSEPVREACGVTPGRATSASCATPSSGL